MKKVTDKEWREKAKGLAEWRKNRTSPPNLDLYMKIVRMVHVGSSCLDVGAGQCHLKQCLYNSVRYHAIDPFPLNEDVKLVSAEDLIKWVQPYHSVFMLSALDNVKDLSKALLGLKHVAMENIVILTSIGIEPDENHTVRIDRKDLTDVLGEPTLEVEMLPRCFLFEWRIK